MPSSGSLPPTKNASQLMDTEPGGEGSQYEGQQVIFDKKPKTGCGQLTENREQVSSSNERFQAKEEIDERERYEEKIRSGTSPSAWSMSGDHGRDSEKIEGTMGKASQGIAFCNEKK